MGPTYVFSELPKETGKDVKNMTQFLCKMGKPHEGSLHQARLFDWKRGSFDIAGIGAGLVGLVM